MNVHVACSGQLAVFRIPRVTVPDPEIGDTTIFAEPLCPCIIELGFIEFAEMEKSNCVVVTVT